MGFLDIFRSDLGGNSDSPNVYGVKLGRKEELNAKTDIKTLLDSAARVKKSNLKMCYLRDDVCYNGVNVKSNLLVPENFRFICRDKEGKRVEEDEQFLEMWKNRIDLPTKLRETVVDAFIGGIGWMENLYPQSEASDDVAIETLSLVDQRVPNMEYIDFLRDLEGNIIWDSNNLEPLAYVQYLSDFADIPKGRDPSQEFGVTPKDRCMILFKHEIFPITFNKSMVGIIEPQYNLIRQKISTMKMAEKTQRNRANPKYHVKVGNLDYRPGPNERGKIKKEISELGADDDIVTDWYVDIKELGMNVNDTALNREEKYVERQCTTMGVPMSYVTGTASGENKSIANDLKIILFKTLIPMREDLARQYLNNTLPYLMTKHKFKSVSQTIEWEPLAFDDLDSKSIRIQRYAKAGLLLPDDALEKHIREQENLPPIEEDIRRMSSKEKAVRWAIDDVDPPDSGDSSDSGKSGKGDDGDDNGVDD